MIINCIADIKKAMKEQPNALYMRLINERLDQALKSYYADLSHKFDSLENKATTNAAKVLKRIM